MQERIVFVLRGVREREREDFGFEQTSRAADWFFCKGPLENNRRKNPRCDVLRPSYSFSLSEVIMCATLIWGMTRVGMQIQSNSAECRSCPECFVPRDSRIESKNSDCGAQMFPGLCQLITSVFRHSLN